MKISRPETMSGKIRHLVSDSTNISLRNRGKVFPYKKCSYIFFSTHGRSLNPVHILASAESKNKYLKVRDNFLRCGYFGDISLNLNDAWKSSHSLKVDSYNLCVVIRGVCPFLDQFSTQYLQQCRGIIILFLDSCER